MYRCVLRATTLPGDRRYRGNAGGEEPTEAAICFAKNGEMIAWESPWKQNSKTSGPPPLQQFLEFQARIPPNEEQGSKNLLPEF
jgi:hypothetical protein